MGAKEKGGEGVKGGISLKAVWKGRVKTFDRFKPTSFRRKGRGWGKVPPSRYGVCRGTRGEFFWDELKYDSTWGRDGESAASRYEGLEIVDLFRRTVRASQGRLEGGIGRIERHTRRYAVEIFMFYWQNSACEDMSTS